jgi:hypothetical protein
MADHIVLPDDETRHTPDDEDLWNESYYCDFVRADGSMGGWLRLGLYPNRQVAWWTAWIVWPDRPGIASVNYEMPVPPENGLVSESEDGERVEIDLRRPLQEFRLAASGLMGKEFADPADAYTDTHWQPHLLDLDLTWTTDGVPYHYDLTTRYEIPCLVSGTVTVEGETFTVDGHGQRDHSWGVRDWWAFGWCWCSMRLDDGTRIHLADIRMFPDVPVFFGYIQRPGVVNPVTALTVTEDIGDHGFPSRARIEIAADPGPGPELDLGIEVTPVSFGPVLLRNDDDGRTSRFPRALVRCRTDDGREGSGWIEWNQPEPSPAPAAPSESA